MAAVADTGTHLLPGKPDGAAAVFADAEEEAPDSSLRVAAVAPSAYILAAMTTGGGLLMAVRQEWRRGEAVHSGG